MANDTEGQEELRLPDELADELGKRVSTYFRVRTTELPVSPTNEQLGQLLKTAYFSSLLEDEGRRVKVRLVLDLNSFARNWVQNRGHQAFADVVLFRSPVEFNAAAVAKLAPAVRTEHSLLIIEPRGDRLGISGLLAIHGAVGQRGAVAFPGIECTIQATASLTVAVADRLVLTYRQGHVAWSLDSSVGASRGTTRVLGLVERALPNSDGHLVTGVILELIRRLGQLPHGGSILLAETKTLPPAILTPGRYALTAPAPFLKVRRREALEWPLNHREPTVETMQTAYQSLWDVEGALDIVAEMTSLDGAVILDGELELHGFGMFVVGNPPPTVLVSDAGTSSAVGDRTDVDVATGFPGARHRSALAFVEHAPASLALVKSQDGGLSLVVKDGARVEVIRNADALLDYQQANWLS
jgi:hypothetical protein